MNSEEVPMSETESLRLISSMINKAKNDFSESGTLYLLWGWLTMPSSAFYIEERLYKYCKT
jgi:hypothetical protein